ncbi:MAG: hypothetical protein ACKOVA_17860 [Novosphingobium sp.]
MATGNTHSPTTPSLTIAPQRTRRLRWIVLGLGLIAVLAAVFLSPIRSYATTGASYGARVACSCRFAGGRNLSDCRKDFEPGMELVTLSEDAQARSVTARFALVTSETATYREGWGCVLEPWK